MNNYHDKLYAVGFTEALSNFQANNYRRGGVGGDAVMAEVQDGGGTDNANFASDPCEPSWRGALSGGEGAHGRMALRLLAGARRSVLG